MSFATASVAMSAAGAASGAIGAYYSAKSSKLSLQTQAALAEINARIAEQGAQSALMAGQQQVAAQTLRAGQIKSSQRAAMAANGVDLGVGSAAETQASTDIMKEIDKNQIEANAVRSAFGYRTQAVNMENDALMKSAAASAISPGMAVTSSLLSSAGSVASSWYGYSKNASTPKTTSNDAIFDMGVARGWWSK